MQIHSWILRDDREHAVDLQRRFYSPRRDRRQLQRAAVERHAAVERRDARLRLRDAHGRRRVEHHAAAALADVEREARNGERQIVLRVVDVHDELRRREMRDVERRWFTGWRFR